MSGKVAPFQMSEGGGSGHHDAPGAPSTTHLRRYVRPVEPAFMKRDADGQGEKRAAAATDEEREQEARYRRELCFFELTDQSPRMYLDPALPLGAAAFNHLAWQCVMSKKGMWVLSVLVVGVITYAVSAVIYERVEEHVCPGFDGRKHPERVAGDLVIWLFCVPMLIWLVCILHAVIYRGFIRGPRKLVVDRRRTLAIRIDYTIVSCRLGASHSHRARIHIIVCRVIRGSCCFR